jgi:acetyl esterase/lipase
MILDLSEMLDPEIKGPIKKMLKEMPPTNFNNLPVARAASRKMTLAMNANLKPVVGVTAEDHTIKGTDESPAVKVRVYRPQKTATLLPAMLWIHGGGYMLGDIDQDDYSTRLFCRNCECAVVSVEYRLAPECPYPGPLEDCYAALKWLWTEAAQLKIDSSRIAVGGGSAGGGLAAGLSILARDRAEVKVMFQLLIYPMIDDPIILPPATNLPDALFWTRASNLIGWRSYLGCQPGGTGISCYAAPYRLTDMGGLPDAYIATGDIDLFAKEDIDYARRLIAAGVPTELHVYPGGCHAFDMLVPNADISKRFNADIYRALKSALHK